MGVEGWAGRQGISGIRNLMSATPEERFLQQLTRYEQGELVNSDLLGQFRVDVTHPDYDELFSSQAIR
jgi:hypothetical protein